MNHDVFARAEEFIWNNARLLERQLFAYHFKGGSRQSVLTALRAYQNADGGWNITWPAVSPSCELEWRGWITLGSLLTLRANGATQ